LNLILKKVLFKGRYLKRKIRLGLTDKGGQTRALQEKLDKIMANADVLITGVNNVR
jgi:phospholipid/cholesterol/gamma-HCH transport system substrate-binding protein